MYSKVHEKYLKIQNFQYKFKIENHCENYCEKVLVIKS